MNKKMKRWITLLLCGVFSFSYAACNDGVEDSSPSKPSSGEETVIPESDNYLIKNNKTEYCIVYPSTSDYYTDFSVLELQELFFTATGVSLPAISDSEAVYSENAKYISVGDTNLLTEAQVIWDKEALGEGGYILKCKGDSVFLAGGAFGTPSAVYDFLTYQFNYEIYALDEIYIDTITKDVKLLDYDLEIKPDMNVNIGEYGELMYNRDASIRMRAQVRMDVFLPLEEKGAKWHNFYGVIAPDVYNNPNRCTVETEHECINDSTAADKAIEDYPDCVAGDYHPEWFSNGQLVLSADVDKMTDVVVEAWKQYIYDSEELGTGKEIAWTFTPMDTGKWSNAPSSKELYEKYGVYSAEYIQFVNEAAKKFNVWLAANYPERRIKYCIFAYQAVTYPPVIKNENGKYVPADESVVLAENVTLMYAPIRQNMYAAMSEEENEQLYDIYEQWKALMPENGESYFWLYNCNYEGQLIPLDFAQSLQSNMIWMHENGGSLILYEEASWGVAPDWSRLNMYLNMKLNQNVYADIHALTDDFFKHYFKDASPAMRKFYNEYRAWFAHLSETTNLTFAYVSEDKIGTKENWPYAMLKQWLDYIDEAYQAVEIYKDTDPVLYKKLCDRIRLESLTVRYLVLRNYAIRIPEKSAYASELLNDCLDLGVTSWGEGTSLGSYLKRFIN